MVGKKDIIVTNDGEPMLHYSVRPSEEPSEVFYTDEGPTFELHITNLIEKPIEVIAPWFVQIGNADNRYEERERLEIEPGAESIRTLTPNLLGVQDSGYVYVETPSWKDSWEVENGVLIAPEPERGNTLYTFSVWDRDFYKLNYIWPRRAQIASAGLAALIVVVGFLSLLWNIWSVIGFPF